MAHPSQGFANWFIRQAMNNEVIQLWGGGESLRDFNYVDDVVEALLLAAASKETDGQAYNLGAFIRKKGRYEEVCGNIKTVGELANLITQVAESGHTTVIPYPVDKKPIEVGHFYADATKIHEALGWEPKVHIQDGIRRTIEFYKKYKQNYWN
jgi:UDP-glucose 4-epimerase